MVELEDISLVKILAQFDKGETAFIKRLKNSSVLPKVYVFILKNFLEIKNKVIDIDDIKRATGKAEAQCRQYLSFFKDNGVIRLINKNGRKYVYGFNPEHNHKEILNEIEEKLQ